MNKGKKSIENCNLRRRKTHLLLYKTAAIFTNDIFRRIFMNEKFSVLIKIEPNLVPYGPIDNNPV